MSVRFSMIAAVGAVALAVCACSAPTASKGADAKTAAACANGAAKLAVVELCPDAAEKLLQIGAGPTPTLPAGCTWTTQSTAIADPDEPNTALLYRAATCKGVTTTLAFTQGGKSDAFTYAASAVYGEAAKDRSPISRHPVESADPKIDIKAQAVLVAETTNEDRDCAVRAAGVEGWPKDALVVDFTDAAKKRLRVKDGEVRSACSFYGFDSGEQKYWLVKQGYAWFFQLGQDDADFDPNSVTLVRKGADGGWAPVVAAPVSDTRD